MHSLNMVLNSPVNKNMSKPHRNGSISGQYNDEYDEDAHEKMKRKHYVPHKQHIAWKTTPILDNLPGSCDDEFFDDIHVTTTVDLSMIRNAAANALSALASKTFDETVEVTEDNCLRPIECTAQSYAWGKIGSSSLVARLKDAQTGNFEIGDQTPYAELWVGTHPNGMSEIVVPASDDDETKEDKKIPLVDYVQRNPLLHLGVEGITEPSQDYDLTFLFKVLSIEKVLSIQAHPDKYLAAQLHLDKPTIYKDPNHKPEMAVALDDNFEAMSGFRPIADIASNVLDYPEFANVIGIAVRRDVVEAVERGFGCNPKPILKKLFRAYMTASDDLVQKNLDALIARLSAKESTNDLDKLILKFADQFPGDSGIFAPIIFNYLKLKKGDAFFIGANEPHAYIRGEILECMACSDNVVRAGLTPKLKDVDTLVKMLTYKSTFPEITRGEKIDENCLLYVPPVEDFAMEIIEISPGSEYTIADVRSPSVLLTLEGSGKLSQADVQSLEVSFGKAAFMSANTEATVTADINGSGLKIVRALSNVHLGKEYL
mmetsp:Transcript_15883/g.19384  ORF Transcript_15883/g.19384 Transcript_15883/m.19384 type:complete len:543 (+) Transcript_15883:240-1868(+)